LKQLDQLFAGSKLSFAGSKLSFAGSKLSFACPNTPDPFSRSAQF
jgi:hypothetical protein